VTRGHYKGRSGKVTSVYRKKWVIHIDRLHREKANGVTANIGFNASKVSVIPSSPSVCFIPLFLTLSPPLSPDAPTP